MSSNKVPDKDEFEKMMEIPGIKETLGFLNNRIEPGMSRHKGRHHFVNLPPETEESQ